MKAKKRNKESYYPIGAKLQSWRICTMVLEWVIDEYTDKQLNRIMQCKLKKIYII